MQIFFIKTYNRNYGRRKKYYTEAEKWDRSEFLELNKILVTPPSEIKFISSENTLPCVYVYEIILIPPDTQEVHQA